jgi:RNA polymerase sigma-70 factor, ECF subfamily
MSGLCSLRVTQPPRYGKRRLKPQSAIEAKFFRELTGPVARQRGGAIILGIEASRHRGIDRLSLMTKPAPQEVSQLLLAWRQGDQSALERLMPIVYKELHRLAHGYMRREKPGHTLQTSALVNEAFVRLMHQNEIDWKNRAHFFGIAAQIMRHILLDHARNHARKKRGDGSVRVSFDETAIVSSERAAELIALDDALNGLAELDARKSHLVELRFFGGLSNQEVAEVLGISLRTVEREWLNAKVWLHHAISRTQPHEA